MTYLGIGQQGTSFPSGFFFWPALRYVDFPAPANSSAPENGPHAQTFTAITSIMHGHRVEWVQSIQKLSPNSNEQLESPAALMHWPGKRSHGSPPEPRATAARDLSPCGNIAWAWQSIHVPPWSKMKTLCCRTAGTVRVWLPKRPRLSPPVLCSALGETSNAGWLAFLDFFLPPD